MRNPHLPVSILMVFLLTGCSHKTVDLESVESPYLMFGQGGGFTGMTSEYFLFDDGLVFMMTEADTLLHLNKASRRKARSMIEKYRDYADFDIYSPDNHYYYITYFSPDSLSTVTWSDNSGQIPEELTEYWKDLIDLTQTH